MGGFQGLIARAGGTGTLGVQNASGIMDGADGAGSGARGRDSTGSPPRSVRKDGLGGSGGVTSACAGTAEYGSIPIVAVAARSVDRGAAATLAAAAAAVTAVAVAETAGEARGV